MIPEFHLLYSRNQDSSPGDLEESEPTIRAYVNFKIHLRRNAIKFSKMFNYCQIRYQCISTESSPNISELSSNSFRMALWAPYGNRVKLRPPKFMQCYKYGSLELDLNDQRFQDFSHVAIVNIANCCYVESRFY